MRLRAERIISGNLGLQVDLHAWIRRLKSLLGGLQGCFRLGKIAGLVVTNRESLWFVGRRRSRCGLGGSGGVLSGSFRRHGFGTRLGGRCGLTGSNRCGGFGCGDGRV